MLHLAIICIACAVSALNEDIAFTERKNNEFTQFCLSDEGKQNITRVYFHRVYNDVNNSSDCGRQKITNRTSYFHDYIVNQYESSRNNSCGAIKTLKNSTLNVDFAFRRRNLLWEDSESTKKKEKRRMRNHRKKRDKVQSKKSKIKEMNVKCAPVNKVKNNTGLSQKEKTLFLRLKTFKAPKSNCLDVKGADIESRVEKFCKKMQLENQLRKENSQATECKKPETPKPDEKTPPKDSDHSVSLFNKISNLFSLRKNFLKNKNQKAVGKSAINSVHLARRKTPVAENTGYISIYDTPTIPETLHDSDIRENSRDLFSDNRDLMPIYRKNLFAKPYPYSANDKSKINFMYPSQKFFGRRRRKRRYKTESEFYRPIEPKNQPFQKNNPQQKSGAQNSGAKGHKNLSEKSLEADQDLINRDEIRVKKSKVLNKKEKKYLSLLNTFREVRDVVGETSGRSNQIQKYERYIPDHTIEKPFYMRDFRNQMQEFDYNANKYKAVTDFPLGSPAYLKHLLQTYTNGFVPLSEYMKVRRALRRCLTRQILSRRKKRCGMKTCPNVPRKCWRSAPLLCIPYIRKGQEDILKYLIRILGKMLGKPCPPKKDIFGRTKYKPLKESGSCDDSGEEECDTCDSTTAATTPCAKSTTVGTSQPNCGSACQTMIPMPVTVIPPMITTACPGSSCGGQQIVTALNGIVPQFAKKNSCTCSQDCPFTASTAVTTNLKANPCVNCDARSNLLVTSSLNNGWLTNPPLLIPGVEGITTQSMNQISNQPSVHPTSSPTTSAPVTAFGSSALVGSGNDIVFPGYANSETTKSSSTTSTTVSVNPIPGVTEPSALATSIDPPHVSATNPSTTLFSSTPVKQEDYFSSTPYSTSTSTESSTVRSDFYSDLNFPKAFDETIKIPNFGEKEPPIFGGDGSYDDDFGNFSFNNHDTQHSPSEGKSSSVASIGDIFRYSFDPHSLKKNEKRRKHDSKKHFVNRKGFHSDDYFFDENRAFDPDFNFYLPRKKIFKLAHQKKIFTPNLIPPVTIPNIPFDYSSYDDYTPPRLSENNKVGFKKRSKKMGKYHSRKNRNRKIKNFESENSLARRKREDDYIWPEIYSDYGDESNYRDTGIIKLQEESLKKNSSEKSSPESWAPPFDDMFDEMARAVSGLMTPESNSGHTTPSTGNISITSDLTNHTKNDTIAPSAGAANITVLTTATPTAAINSGGNISGANSKTTTPTPNKGIINASTTPHSVADASTVPIFAATVSSSISNARTAASSIITEASKAKNQTTEIQNEKPLKIESTTSMASTAEKKSSLLATTTSQTPNSSRPIRIEVISSKLGGKLVGTRGANNLKSGKTSFFQTNSKTNLSDMEPSTEKTSKKDSGKEEKNGKGNQDSDNGEGQVATTLKMAVIVKGPKKLVTKPSPKVFSKVYPDSFDFEVGVNETTAATTMATSKPFLENKTALLSSTLKPDTRLQLLAVCEGYLEIIKRIKALNQTFGENLDAELAQYCESIISQSFNTQVEKPKKTESSESSLKTNSGNADNIRVTNKINLLSALQDAYENEKKFPDSQDNFIFDQKNDEVKKNSGVDKKSSETDSLENPKSTEKKINNKQNVKDETGEENVGTEEGILKRGISEEQVNLIKLLKKRKRALMSWLMNSRDEYKSDELPETEYFDDEDYIPPDSDFSEYSGTIKPKRNEKSPKRTTEFLYFINKTLYPVYAKRYGYDKDGELREVEVLWRKVNEKTHEEKILKNMSVIAFLMTSTSSPNIIRKEKKPFGKKGYEGEDLSENELNIENKVGYAREAASAREKTSPPETEKPKGTLSTATSNIIISTSTRKNETAPTNSTSKKPKPAKKNETHTYISKPELSSIVGAPPIKNKTSQNITRKVSHKFGVAKDIFQEYSIEFLNYAVYILPAMFTILFFFCCFGCALYILKTRKSFRKFKKKKRPFSSDETSETSDDSEDSRKKRKREAKRKKKPYSEVENLEKKVKKKFWNVLKMPHSNNKELKELNEENGHSERKNFLRFLKGRKDENKAEGNKFSKNYHDSGDESDQSGAGGGSHKKEEKHKGEANSEAVERRELISLLEELKKIELEHTGEKKEVKSVQVQYAIEHDENPFCQRPEFSYPYEKNIFGLPKGYFFCSRKFPCHQTNPPVVKDFELYGDVSEMTELLPCECDYYAKKNDYFRHCDFRFNQEGRSKHIYKIYRDSGVNQNKPLGDKNFLANDSANQNLAFNKYRSINSDTSEEFMSVNKKNVGTDVRLNDDASPFRLLFKKNTGFVEEMGNMKHHLSKKKYVRLKDDGVLCRL